jgi:DNA-binding SARP family transcriptional activator
MALCLTLFAGFQARLTAGEAVSLPTRKAQALLAYLGVRPGHAHPRDKLAAFLWSDSSDERARDSLRHALAGLRRALPATTPPVLLIEGQTLALSPAVVDVDVPGFEQRVADGTPDALEKAIGLYQGDLLHGFSLNEPLFEEWLVPGRERLRELALEALAKLLTHQSKSGNTEPAIRTASRLLALRRSNITAPPPAFPHRVCPVPLPSRPTSGCRIPAGAAGTAPEPPPAPPAAREV